MQDERLELYLKTKWIDVKPVLAINSTFMKKWSSETDIFAIDQVSLQELDTGQEK